MSHEEIYKDAKNRERLILPKLKAVRDNGNGATIHEVNSFLCVISGWENIYKLDLKQNNQSELMSSAVTYREYIKSAEIWLAKIASNISGDNQ